MKFVLVAVSAAFAGLVASQTQGSLPTCATGCVTTLLPASCNNNPECICKDTNFITNISCCIYNACPTSDQEAALNFAKTYCTPVGVTLPASAGCSAGATSASGSASASASASPVSSSISASASSVSSSASSAAASATSKAAGEKLTAQGISLLGAVAGAIVLL